MRDDRVKELFLGLILIVILILLSVLVISVSNNSFYQKQDYVATNNNLKLEKSYQISQQNIQNWERTYTSNKNVKNVKQKSYSKPKYLSYSSHGNQEKKKGIFGNDIQKYEVHVKNRDYKEGRFTVKYYFKDSYGKVKTTQITHQIRAREEKQFLLKDVTPNKYKRVSWRYEVISHSKKPTEKYRNSNDDYYNYQTRNNFRGSPTITYFFYD